MRSARWTESDLSNRVQRTADWLRRGINPNSNGTEAEIASGLKKLNDQVRQAQQGMGTGRDGQGKTSQGAQTAELDHVDRLRSEIQSLSNGRGQQGQRPGQGTLQGGQRPGQSGQTGQSGQRGQAVQPGQGGQRGQAQGGQQGDGPQAGGQQGNGQSGRQNGQRAGQGGDRRDGDSGDIGNVDPRGGGGGVVIYNVNTGNNKFDQGRRANAPDNAPTPTDSERAASVRDCRS